MPLPPEIESQVRLLFLRNSPGIILNFNVDCLETYDYEILNEHYEEVFMSYNNQRRDTRSQQSTEEPGVETEQEPSATTSKPTIPLSTKPALSKQTTEGAVETSTPKVPPVTTLSTNTSNDNYTINVSKTDLKSSTVYFTIHSSHKFQITYTTL
jgi:activator of HSP90 ATPase